MALLVVDNSTPEFFFIRPSGNTRDSRGFKQMITRDMVQEKQK